MQYYCSTNETGETHNAVISRATRHEKVNGNNLRSQKAGFYLLFIYAHVPLKVLKIGVFAFLLIFKCTRICTKVLELHYELHYFLNWSKNKYTSLYIIKNIRVRIKHSDVWLMPFLRGLCVQDYGELCSTCLRI